MVIIKNAYSNIGKSRKEKFKVAEAKGYLETKELLKEARGLISAFAVTSKMMNTLSQSRATLKVPLALLEIRSLNSTIDNTSINDVALALQLMLKVIQKLFKQIQILILLEKNLKY